MNFIDAVAPFLSSILAALITYILTRRKNSAEVDKVRAETASIEIKNVESVLAFWKKLAEDLTQRVEDLSKEVTCLRNENKNLTTEIKNLERTIGKKL